MQTHSIQDRNTVLDDPPAGDKRNALLPLPPSRWC